MGGGLRSRAQLVLSPLLPCYFHIFRAKVVFDNLRIDLNLLSLYIYLFLNVGGGRRGGGCSRAHLVFLTSTLFSSYFQGQGCV